MPDCYDIVIVGGGIAGLYTAYKVLKQQHQRGRNGTGDRDKRVVVLEKLRSTLGGRIDTYHDRYMDVEAGAGRIHSSHRLILELVREFGLELVKINHSVAFMSDRNPGVKLHSLLDLDLETQSKQHLRSDGMPYEEIVAELLAKSRGVSKRHLMGMTLLEYAREVFLERPKMVSTLVDTFGYYSELAMMNAHDSLQLMRVLGPKNQFYGVVGGLSQIVENLAREIRRMGGDIIMGENVIEIRERRLDPTHLMQSNGIRTKGGKPTIRKTRKIRTTGGFEISCESGNTYYSKTCVCALPKQAIQRIAPGSMFSSIRGDLDRIECGSLCRIYCTFDKGADGKVWFRDLGKITTDNDLRMVIPIDVDRGVIMISYTDNQWADAWNQMYKEEGVVEVNRRLRKLVSAVVGYTIPMPKHTQLFYWKCGVGYWGKGADSRRIAERVLEPRRGLFVCGEHYSSTHQQWMEGALRTSSRVIRKLLSR